MADLTEVKENRLTPMDHSEGDFGDDFDSKRCTDVQDFRISKGNNPRNSKLGILVLTQLCSAVSLQNLMMTTDGLIQGLSELQFSPC